MSTAAGRLLSTHLLLQAVHLALCQLPAHLLILLLHTPCNMVMMVTSITAIHSWVESMCMPHALWEAAGPLCCSCSSASSSSYHHGKKCEMNDLSLASGTPICACTHLEGSALEHEHAASLRLLGEAHSLQLLFEGLDLGGLGLVVLFETLELTSDPWIQQQLPHLQCSRLWQPCNTDCW